MTTNHTEYNTRNELLAAVDSEIANLDELLDAIDRKETKMTPTEIRHTVYAAHLESYSPAQLVRLVTAICDALSKGWPGAIVSVDLDPSGSGGASTSICTTDLGWLGDRDVEDHGATATISRVYEDSIEWEES